MIFPLPLYSSSASRPKTKPRLTNQMDVLKSRRPRLPRGFVQKEPPPPAPPPTTAQKQPNFPIEPINVTNVTASDRLTRNETV